MSAVFLCIDAQSPELSTPCPTSSGGLVSPPPSLPDTGIELMTLIAVAVFFITVGVAFYLWSKT